MTKQNNPSRLSNTQINRVHFHGRHILLLVDSRMRVVGMRNIEKDYRQTFGANWTLVGDAVHYKDPSDGQGLYNAVLESILLAQSIINWKINGMSWNVAGANYQQQMTKANYPRFKQTVANVKQTFYSIKTPEFVVKTVVHWMLKDPNFQTQFLR